MDPKSILKTFKLNESTISVILGALVLVVVGVLVVNYFKGINQATTLPGTSTQSSETAVEREGETYHVVQSGDTLWSISEKYYDSGYNWVDIADVNSLTNPDLIEKGQEVLIPTVEPKTATVVVDTSTQLSVKTDVYTVKTGDTLWQIAVDVYGDGYRWTDIANTNSLDNPNIIHSGNTLKLPS